MDYSVGLSSSARQSVLSLQGTAAMSSVNQTRLTTGKNVSSALDDPVKFFAAQGLTDRASALTNLLGGMSNGIQTVQAASKGIDTMIDYVKQLQSVVQQAQNNSAQNLPKITSNPLATATEAATTGQSVHDFAMNKSVLTQPAPPTGTPAPTNGSLGLTASVTTGANPAAATVQIKSGNSTYSFAVGATDKVSDVVAQINKSGVANATVDSQGDLQVTGVGSDPLTVSFGKVATKTGVFTADAAGTTSLFGGTTSNVSSTGGGSAARSALVDQFNTLVTQINNASQDASFNGVNLLNGDKTTVVFNEKSGPSQSKLDVQGMLTNSTTLGIGKMQDSTAAASGSDFSVQNNGDLQKASSALTNAISTLKAQSAALTSNQAVIQTRQDFTNNLTNILNTGASNLTDADMNEEAAKSQALQLRQSLGISALSMANQASQGVLQLLR